MATGILGRLTGGILGNAIGYGVGSALGPTLAPLTQEMANEFWPELPVVPIPPADLAAMAVQGVMHESDAAVEAKMQGINEERFHKLFLVNGDPIAPEQALDLWNRGEISEAEVSKALLQSRLKPEWVDTFKLLRRQLLQGAELAEMVVQSVLPEGEATKRAEHLGIHADDFAHLVRLAGNPPGPQDTLSLWNRGIFNEAEATLALRQSRLKPEWIELYKRSRIRPATTEQAVMAVVKQRITHKEGEAIAHENGIDPATFKMLVNEAGRPISIMEALTLLNRKEYTEQDVRQVVARSDIKTEYADAILKLRVRYPSITQIRTLVQHNAIEDGYAIELLLEQGYPEKLATGVVQAGHAQKTQSERDLTKSEINTLYQGGGLSRDDASGMLQQLGYSETEASQLLDLAEFRRLARFFEAVINRVHAKYVARQIGSDTVTTELDMIGVPTAQREELLTLWTEERGANVRLLTEAQIVRAHKANLLTEQDATDRLVNLGYSQPDAAILLAL